VSALASTSSHELTKPKPLRVRGKLRNAIEFAVTEGLEWSEASKKAGLTTRAMRKAQEKPHVIRYIRERKALFRAEINTKNEHRLAALRDQNSNQMAAVAAIKTLEQFERDQSSSPTLTRNVTPGVVVVINNHREPHALSDKIIEVNSLQAGPDG
jgi:hypothetical protein